MKSAQQGTFSCQNAVFLVNRLALYQGRGLAAFQTGRDICSQKSLSIYTWQDRNDSVYLCALQVQPLLAGVRKHYLPSQSARRSSAQNYHSLSGAVCGCSSFFYFCTQHTFLSDSGVLHSLCVNMCVNMCEYVLTFMLQDPRRGLVSVL